MTTLPKENRVRLADYGTLPPDDPRVVEVPSKGKTQKLHWYAGEALANLSEASEQAGHGPILVLSGLRRRRWPSLAAYQAQVLATPKYQRHDADGNLDRAKTLRVGAGAIAYKSAHETGLIIDIGSPGFVANTNKAEVARMRELPLFLWLVDNAGRYGWTPYNEEPWHWELNVPMTTWTAQPGGVSSPAAGRSRWRYVAGASAAVGLVAFGIWRFASRRA